MTCPANAQQNDRDRMSSCTSVLVMLIALNMGSSLDGHILGENTFVETSHSGIGTSVSEACRTDSDTDRDGSGACGSLRRKSTPRRHWLQHHG